MKHKLKRFFDREEIIFIIGFACGEISLALMIRVANFLQSLPK